MKIATIIGTRPEIIKMSRLIPLLDDEFEHKFIYTGQHFSENMSNIFFSELKVRNPDINLNLKTSEYPKLITSCVKVLKKINPDFVLVYGDTNSTLSGAISTKILNKKLIHVEAGLRSFDREMFEEVNRIVTDHLSQFLFTPTNYTKNLLNKEGLIENVFVVGNTIVDAVNFYSKEIKNSDILDKLGLKENEYILLTLHRSELVDRAERLKSVIMAVKEISDTIVFPIHPRTKMRLKEFELNLPKNVKGIEPIGYFDFLNLLKNSSLVMTDSGGVQEEAITLKVPCVTIRRTTERQETIELGANFLTGFETKKIVESVKKIKEGKMKDKIKKLPNPYGDGKTSKKIIKKLKQIV
jgi:UDP-N-acetylglucosamine 2-epimerase (non-hydrolysing)